MAIKFTPRVRNIREAMLMQAKNSPLFDINQYNAMDSLQATNYAGLVASSSEKDLTNFDFNTYRNLTGNDKIGFLSNNLFNDNSEEVRTNNKYFEQISNKNIAEIRYNELNGWQQFINTTGGILGNAVVNSTLGVASDIENLVNFINPATYIEAAMRGQDPARILAEKNEKGVFINQYKVSREQMNQWIAEATFIDKNGVARVIDGVTSGLARMAPMFLGLPYPVFAAIGVGGTVGRAIQGNPDISYANLFSYTALNTATNILTDRLFTNAIFGKGLINQARWAKGAISYTMLSMTAKGLSDMAGQVISSVLYQQLVNKNAPLASWEDIMYAGIIGAIITGITTGVKLVRTPRQTIITFDGSSKKLSHYQSFLMRTEVGQFGERFAEYAEDNPIIRLQAKYSDLNVEQIRAQYGDEYTEAYNATEMQAEALTKGMFMLSKIYANLGADKYNLATKLALDSMQYQAAQMAAFVADISQATVNAQTPELLELAKKYSINNPGASIKFPTALTPEQLQLVSGVKNILGKDVVFVEFGAQDGTPRNDGMAISENKILLDVNVFNDSSFTDVIKSKVIREEIIHTMQMNKNIINPASIKMLQTIMIENFGNEYLDLFKRELPKEYTDKLSKAEKTKLGNLIKSGATAETSYVSGKLTTLVAEHQAKAMTEMLLFDKFTIQNVFTTNKDFSEKVYSELHQMGMKFLKMDIETKEVSYETAKTLNTLSYQKIHNILNLQLESIGETITNEASAEPLQSKLHLSNDKIAKLKAAIGQSGLYPHFAFSKIDLSNDSSKMLQVHMELEKAMGLPISDNITEMQQYSNLYAKIFDVLQYDASFVKLVQEQYPISNGIIKVNPWKWQLNNYILDKYNVIFNESIGSFIKQVELSNYTIQTIPEKVDTTLSKTDQKDATFNLSDFIDIQKLNIPNIPVIVDFTTENGGSYSPTTNRMEMSIDAVEYKNFTMTEKNAIIMDMFYHEIAHYMSELSSLPTGANPNAIADMIKYSLLAPKDKENYNQLINKNDKIIGISKNKLNQLYDMMYEGIDRLALSVKGNIIDTTAFLIYQMVDGEINASLQKSGLGSFGNTSGFSFEVTESGKMILQGRGKFDFVRIEAPSSALITSEMIISRVPLREGFTLESKTGTFKDTFSKEFLVPNEITGTNPAKKFGFSEDFINLFKLENPVKGEGFTRVNLESMLSENKVGNSAASTAVMKYLFPDTQFESFDQVLAYRDWMLPQLEILKFAKLLPEKEILTINDITDIFNNVDNQTAIKQAQEQIARLVTKGTYIRISDQLDLPQNASKANLRILQYDSDVSLESFDKLYQQSIVNINKGRLGFQPIKAEQGLTITAETKEGPEEFIAAGIEKRAVETREIMLSPEEQLIAKEEAAADLRTEQQKQEQTLKDRVARAIRNFNKATPEEQNTIRNSLINNREQAIKEFGQEGYNDLLQKFTTEGASLKNIKDSIWQYRKKLEQFKDANEVVKLASEMSLKGLSLEKAQELLDIYKQVDGVLRPKIERGEKITKQDIKEIQPKLTRLEQGLQEKRPFPELKTREELQQPITHRGASTIKDPVARGIYKQLTNTEAISKVESQVKNVTTKRLSNDAGAFSNFIEANEVNLSKINDNNVKDILGAMFNPNVAYTDFQRANNFFTMSWLFNHTGLFNAENVSFIEQITQEQASLAGVQLNSLKSVYHKARPLNSFVKQWETEFGKRPEGIDQAMINDYNEALLAKNYKRLIELENEVIKIASAEMPDDSINFFKGSISERITTLKTLAKRFESFRYMAMLSNPSTHIRNWFSNRLVRGMDAVTNFFEEKVQNIFKFKEGQLKYRAHEKPSEEVKAYVQEKLVDTGLVEYLARGSKYDINNEDSLFDRVLSKSQFNTQWLNKVNNFISKSLAGEDARSVYPKIIEYAEQLIQANYENVDSIKPQQLQNIIEDASARALTLYFKNQNLFSKTWQKLQNTNPVLDIMMGGILPFSKITSNVLKRIYEFSPFNFANALAMHLNKSKGVKMDQFYTAKMVHKYTQAGIGTSLWALGASLMFTGLIHFDRQDEYGGMVFQVGDFKVKLSDVGPAWTPLLLGAALTDFQDGGNLFTRGMKLINEATFLGTLDNIVKYNSTAVDALKYPFETYLKQYIPAISRSLAKIVDPHTKRTGGNLIDQLLSGIPGVSYIVPNKVDPITGEDETRYDIPVLNDIVNAASPMRLTYKKVSDVQVGLRAAGTDITAPAQKITINGEDFKLDNKEYKSYQQKRAQILTLELNKLFATPKYQKMSQEDQKAEINKSKLKATEIAKINYWINKGKSYNFKNYKEFTDYIIHFENTKGITFIPYKPQGFK